MVLAIDIGNTNITLGCFDGDSLSFVARLATVSTKTGDEYAVLLLNILAIHNVDKSQIKGAIISSVVPPINAAMNKAVESLYGVKPINVGPGIKTGISIHCDTPSSVGSDLICGCVAAHQLYGSPCLIVDMGTATKMTVVNSKGAFIGVSIIPGVRMGMQALAMGTAQLPQVSLEAPSAVIAKNTVDCVKSGIIYGNAALVDGMIERIKAELGYDLPVYATGGLASLILPYCKNKITYDPDLVLKGLYFIYSKNL